MLSDLMGTFPTPSVTQCPWIGWSKKSTPKSAEIRAQSESPSLIKPRANCQALREEHEDENTSPLPPEHISQK